MNKVFSIITLSAILLIACSQPEYNTADQTEVVNNTEIPVSNVEKTEESSHILIFGDSITAGQGVNPEDAFPALIQSKIDSLDLDYHVINGGLSGDTSAGGLRRIDWMLKEKVDIFIFELGANDGLRGLDVGLTQENSEAILSKVQEKYPDAQILVAGMMIPPNLGAPYTEAFRTIFPNLARKFDATLIPFILEDVAGIQELNQSDGIHPTEEGHKIISNTVWQYLEPLL